jgi:predicted negative regulator of RcsB-dependent stress response
VHYEAMTLLNIGDSCHAAGDRDAARRAWQGALEIMDRLDMPETDAVRAKLCALDQPSPADLA